MNPFGLGTDIFSLLSCAESFERMTSIQWDEVRRVVSSIPVLLREKHADAACWSRVVDQPELSAICGHVFPFVTNARSLNDAKASCPLDEELPSPLEVG